MCVSIQILEAHFVDHIDIIYKFCTTYGKINKFVVNNRYSAIMIYFQHEQDENKFIDDNHNSRFFKYKNKYYNNNTRMKVSKFVQKEKVSF